MTKTDPGRVTEPVVVFMPHFSPGFKIGGPLQSVLGMIAFLSGSLSVRVLTLNRDYTETVPYAGIPTGKWLRCTAETAEVQYCTGLPSALRALRKACQGRTLYLQSCFSPGWSILPLALARIGVLRPRRIVVAPRGELSTGALSVRPAKKRVALSAIRLLALHRNAWFQSTCEEESDEIEQRLGIDPARIVLLRNLPARRPACAPARRIKQPGELRMVFLSRISPKKNLHQLLGIMAALPDAITLDIYGPSDDSSYFSQCKAIVDAHHLHPRIRFHDAVQPEEVSGILPDYDVFVLPTKGENFGHAVYEALAVGLPAILSDMTPWRDLWAQQAGADVDIQNPDALRDAILRFAAMDADGMDIFRRGAVAVAQRYIEQALDVPACHRLFGHQT